MSQILNRIIPPSTNNIDRVPFELPTVLSFSNETKFCYYDDRETEVVRIEFLFDAGSRFQAKKLQASFTNKLITSGTGKWNARQIAEQLDQLGAYFDQGKNEDFGSLTLFTLSKYAPDLLKVISEIMLDSMFPEDELDTYRNISRQKFMVDCEKVNFLARSEFNNLIFGSDHPYGGKTILSDYDQIMRQDLINFEEEYYRSCPLIMAAGSTDDQLIQTIRSLFGGSNMKVNHSFQKVQPPKEANGRMIIEKKDAVQSAIRIGRKLFNKTHPDYSEMLILSMVLGGYFGSRLMRNLREDKGYTYGIGSRLVSLKDDGYFFISTEVGSDSVLDAEKEIHNEIKLLRENEISSSELNTVQSYMLGELLRGSDGVMSSMDRYKSLCIFNQNDMDFQKHVEQIKNVRPARIVELANKWLKDEDLLTVIAGRA